MSAYAYTDNYPITQYSYFEWCSAVPFRLPFAIPPLFLCDLKYILPVSGSERKSVYLTDILLLLNSLRIKIEKW
jgi:hypothetical protein